MAAAWEAPEPRISSWLKRNISLARSICRRADLIALSACVIDAGSSISRFGTRRSVAQPACAFIC